MAQHRGLEKFGRCSGEVHPQRDAVVRRGEAEDTVVDRPDWEQEVHHRDYGGQSAIVGEEVGQSWGTGWRTGSGWLQCRTRTAGRLSAGPRVRAAGPSTGSGTGEWCSSGASRECGSGAGIRTASVPTGWLPTCAATDSATGATAGIPAAADPAASAAGSGESDRGRGGRYAAG